MTPDVASLVDLQSCPRKFLLNREWRPLRWRPKALLDACLRQAVLEVSKGVSVRDARVRARTMFMQTAANPGLEITKGSPYDAAQEWVALLDVLATSIPYLNLSSLREGHTVKLGEKGHWKLTAQVDTEGTLHRIITIDSWSEADLQREKDSWWITGDIAASGKPLVLNVIEIGQTRNGVLSSPWTRVYRHPVVKKTKFRLKDGGVPKGWDPLRLTAMENVDIEAWTAQLWREGVGRERTYTFRVEPPEQAAPIVQDMLAESSRMQSLAGTGVKWASLPMFRSACHGMTPCPFIPVCYLEQVTSVESLGLYQRRKEPYAVTGGTAHAAY